ncbi:MAG: Hpt domain-containing protein [Bacteroidota bacterium]|nr:Hpt domain-containing protein [Bacteroidota bacterium]
MIVNIEAIKKQYNMQGKVLKSMLELFVKSSEFDIALLKETANKKDVEGIKKIAHKLKSGYGYMLLADLVSTCDEIKHVTDNQKTFESVQPILTKLFELQKKVVIEIKENHLSK